MPPLPRRRLDDVDPAAGLPLHPLGSVGRAPFDPQGALDAGAGALDRDLRKVGENHQFLVGPFGAATNLEPGRGKLIVEVGQLDEEIGATEG